MGTLQVQVDRVSGSGSFSSWDINIAPGADGTNGVDGTNGANGADGTDPGILLTWDTGTTDANPGSGKIRANNASLASATTLFISKTNRGGSDISAYLATLDDSTNTIKGQAILTDPATDKQAVFNVTALTDATGYIKLTIATPSGETSFSAGAISFQFARAGNTVSSDGDVVDALVRMRIAKVDSLAQFYGMRFADSFGALTYYDSGNSSAVDTATAGLLKLGTAIVSQANGTVIGNMSGGGGLAAAFDGVTSQTSGSSAQTTAASTSGYNNTVGKDWGSGVTRIVTRITLYAPSNVAMLAAGGGGTIKLQGSNDNSAWTDLYTSGTILATAGSSADVTTGIDISTAYRYHRINVNGNGTNFAQLAEVQMYAAASGMTVRSTAISIPSVPSLIKLFARIKHVDSSVAGTDYNLYVSRDGGATFSSAAVLTDNFTDPNDSAHIISSASVDVSGQPSGSSVVLKLVTANGKNIELRDWAFSAS